MRQRWEVAWGGHEKAGMALGAGTPVSTSATRSMASEFSALGLVSHQLDGGAHELAAGECSGWPDGRKCLGLKRKFTLEAGFEVRG